MMDYRQQWEWKEKNVPAWLSAEAVTRVSKNVVQREQWLQSHSAEPRAVDSGRTFWNVSPVVHALQIRYSHTQTHRAIGRLPPSKRQERNEQRFPRPWHCTVPGTADTDGINESRCRKRCWIDSNPKLSPVPNIFFLVLRSAVPQGACLGTNLFYTLVIRLLRSPGWWFLS